MRRRIIVIREKTGPEKFDKFLSDLLLVIFVIGGYFVIAQAI